MKPGTRVMHSIIGSFANALHDKLDAAEEKYGWDGAWQTAAPEVLRADLMHHIEKGDPVDVAAFCMFLWERGEKTA